MGIIVLFLLLLAVLVWFLPVLLKTILRRLVKKYMGVDIDMSHRQDKDESRFADTKADDGADERPHPTDGHKIFGDDEGEYISYTEVKDS